MKFPLIQQIFFQQKRTRGIATVYIALLLVVIFAFVGLAIDIGYMYVSKTQLQNAADAASLAGATLLIEKSKSFNQPLAREEAWKFACRNKATLSKSSVFLVSSANNCTSPPADLNNTNNDPEGDIVLGNWNDATGFTPSSSTNLNPPFINAVKVVARRTAESPIANVKIGNNPITLFFGKLLALLPGGGTGWAMMNASAEAIAVRNNPPVSNLTLCLPSCGSITTLSTVYPNITPGIRHYTKGTNTPLIGWTTFFDVDTSVTNLNNYLTGDKAIPDLCNLPPPRCLNTTNGVDNPIMCTLKGILNEQSSDYQINGVSIHGYKTFIPIVDSSVNPCIHKGTACINDPTYQPGDAFPFIYFAEVIITDSVPQGNCPKVTGPLASGTPGVVLVGTGPAATGFSSIQCVSCDDVAGVFTSTARLVK